MSQDAPPATFCAADFREVLGHFCSGVTVVAAMDDDQPVGMTCQSFFSVSLEPPLVAFSPAKTSSSYPRIRTAGAFCVNILAHDQAAVCQALGRSGPDKWRGLDWRRGPSGSPILEGVQAWVDCQLEAEHEAGDHWLTIGRVTALQAFAKSPLLFYRGRLRRIRPHDD